MFIPEIPIFNLSFKARCPACNETIGGHVVKNRFSCPFCKKILQSNKEKVINQAILVGIVLYVTLFAIINFTPIKEWELLTAVVAASFAPILIGYGYFKFYFKVTEEKVRS